MQAVRVARGEDHVGSLLARAPGRLEPDARAAADHDDGLPEQRRLMAGRSDGGCGSHRSSSCQTAAGFWPRPLVPPVEGREVARVPGLAESRGAQVPVGADLARHGAQVVPEVDDRRAAPEPVAVVDAVDHEARLEHERVRDHRVVLGVGVLLNVEVLLNRSVRVGEEGPLGADRRTELLERVVVVGRDRGDLGVRHGDLRVERGELQMLLVLLRAVVAAREREDQRVVALQLAEPAWRARVIGQLVVGKGASGRDVSAHGWSPSSRRQLRAGLLRHHVRGVPVGPVRVSLPGALLVLAVGGLRPPHALARSPADANAVSPASIRPGSRVVISCSSQPLPSGSLNDTNDP